MPHCTLLASSVTAMLSRSARGTRQDAPRIKEKRESEREWLRTKKERDCRILIFGVHLIEHSHRNDGWLCISKLEYFIVNSMKPLHHGTHMLVGPFSTSVMSVALYIPLLLLSTHWPILSCCYAENYRTVVIVLLYQGGNKLLPHVNFAL